MLENPERSGTERNGTEPEVIDAQYGHGRRIHIGKIGVIGASLSELHTSVTALHDTRVCVCLQPYTVNI